MAVFEVFFNFFIRLQPFAELRARAFFFCFQLFWAGQRLQAQFSSVYLVNMLNLLGIPMRSSCVLRFLILFLPQICGPSVGVLGHFGAGQL
jgi:hypothetical protein